MQDLLEQYNPQWQQPYRFELIPRDRYNDDLSGLLERKEIIVLKGIRRSGKSSLLKLAINRLLDNGVNAANLLFMNMEDYRFGSEKSLQNLDDILNSYREIQRPRGKQYIFLDEIQEVPEFERWLRTYYEQENDLKFIITGSSSSLFSSELATLLTGRQISIEVFPFSFRECLLLAEPKVVESNLKKPVDGLYLSAAFKIIEPQLTTFLDEGGFPEVVKNRGSDQNLLMLQQYISDIILRDITQRYNIRKIEILQKLALYLIFNMSSGLNITRLAELVGSNRTTVLDLIAHLKEVYMIFTTTSFSFAVNEQLNSTRAKQIYCIDNGFYGAIKTDSYKELEKKMKNCVFQKLRFEWGKEVFYWRDKVEIDFVLEEGFPINVSDSDDADVLERNILQMFHFLHRHNRPQGLIVSWNKLQIHEENGRKIIIMPLWMFLLKTPAEIMGYGM